MTIGTFRVPTPTNEPVRELAPGCEWRTSLKSRLAELTGGGFDIPLIIGGKEVRTGNTGTLRSPHDHRRDLGKFHQASTKDVEDAIAAAEAARPAWQALPFEERAAIFLKAADLLAGPWRDTINASTMLGQSKTAHQAEIDAACELIDFLKFNVHFAERLYAEQPESSTGCWNRLEHRCLDGFVFAVAPFNFTSIAGNLPTAPALLGNTVLFKPASTSVLSNWFLMQIFEAAGLPPGVINFVPGSGATVGDPVIASPRFGGLHFTGSTATFQHMWKTIGNNISRYGQYPRIVGETGGKDFVIAHGSSDPAALAVALVRGSFEYQGQKCSAASRAYVPKSLWPDVKERMAAMMAEIQMGDVADFRNYMGAVIDAKSFKKQKDAIEGAHANPDTDVAIGGECDDSTGYFVQPTVIESRDPKSMTMCTELFGPVLSVHVFDDAKWDEALELCATSSDYALTGAVFCRDRNLVKSATEKLRFAAGNFYVNDKPTGAVVGQQPFGGGRASGTNDKAGSILNLLRWVSPRTIKETFDPPHSWRYPFMDAE